MGLPREEWDFYNLGEQELQFAFFYEYGRDSDAVKREVEKMRAARPQPHIWPYWPREHHLNEALFWLAQQDSFPATPWLNLKKEAIKQVRQKRAETRNEETRINAGLHEFIKLPPRCKVTLPTKSPEESVEAIEWMCAVLRGSNVALRPHIGFEHVWLGNAKAVRAWHEKQAGTFVFPPGCEIEPRPDYSVLKFAINWRLTDKEIMDMVSGLITGARPCQFKADARTPHVQLSFNGALPFRTISALQWLGVLRLRNSVKTWREFFERYRANALSKTGSGTVKSRDVSELARPPKEDCRKAKLVLDWFNRGTSLRKEEFE